MDNDKQPVILATPVEGDRQPWDRQPDESSYWYDAFLAYRNLPPHKRTIIEAYRQRKATQGIAHPKGAQASGDWYRQRAAMRWDNRATLYDDYILRQAEAESQHVVKQWYARSRLDLVDCWDDLIEIWRAIEDMDMSRNQVAQAMKTISQLVTPTAPTQSVDVQIILDKLPADVQTALLDALSKR
jgi:hypothetical protein